MGHGLRYKGYVGGDVAGEACAVSVGGVREGADADEVVEAEFASASSVADDDSGGLASSAAAGGDGENGGYCSRDAVVAIVGYAEVYGHMMDPVHDSAHRDDVAAAVVRCDSGCGDARSRYCCHYCCYPPQSRRDGSDLDLGFGSYHRRYRRNLYTMSASIIHLCTRAGFQVVDPTPHLDQTHLQACCTRGDGVGVDADVDVDGAVGEVNGVALKQAYVSASPQ